MDESVVAAKLGSDSPQTDPDLDELGYRAFARQLAKGVAGMLPTEGMVLGIYAPWGSGKSTALNYIENFLSQEPEDTKPVIVRFNPWWFSGDENLVRHFFSQLEASLEKEMKEVAKELKGKIAGFAESVSKLPLVKLVGVGNVNVKDVSESLAKLLGEEPKDVVALKSQIDSVLRDQSKTILVVIDDIDRLSPDEIRQLFRLIKAVADFPKVAYLLAFDKEVVATALGGQPGIDGVAYLEKIVQVPFELPVPERDGLGQMLFARLDAVVNSAPQADFSVDYWSNVYFDGVQGFIDTPRDVVRLTNSLAVTYPAIFDEVNTVDFIAIETIRVFEPLLYDAIRRNEDRFTQSSARADVEDDRRFFADCLAKVGEDKRTHAKRLLGRIFPRTGERGLSNDWLPEWRRSRRICVADFFPAYFRLGLPEGAIKSREIQEALSTLENQDALEGLLLGYANRKGTEENSRVRALLTRLEDYTAEAIPVRAISSVIGAMFDVGDALEEADERRAVMFDLGVGIQLGRLFYQLMRRLPPDERFALMKRGCEEGKALATIVSRLVVLGQEQGRSGKTQPSPEERWIVSAEQLTELQSIAVDRIRRKSEDFTLLWQYHLSLVLYWWAEWSGRANEVRDWVADAIDLDGAAVTFLTHFLGETMSQTAGERYVKRNYTLSPSLVSEYVGLDAFAERMRGIDLSIYSERQKTAVTQFLKEYDDQ